MAGGAFATALLFCVCAILASSSSSSSSSSSFTSAAAAFEELPPLAFEEGYTRLFGDGNLMLLRDGKTVHIALDERTGAGFASQELYLHGFFSASIKLPSDYAAGVVVAFYLSNGDVFEKTHDELDFEFLGNIRGKEWRIQTNVYGNGSTATGREERYDLWFDPTEDFHRYSILWNEDQIVFFVDGVAIREIVKNEAMARNFPAKPMSLYATIWDGSSWATSGGRYKVDYRRAPYVAEFADLVLSGCVVNPIDHSPACGSDVEWRRRGPAVDPAQRRAMAAFRKKQMTYSYCYDKERYPEPPAECVVDGEEARRIAKRRRRSRHRHSRPATAFGGSAAAL